MESEILILKQQQAEIIEKLDNLTILISELHAAQVGTLIEKLSLKPKKPTKKELAKLKELEEELLIEKLRNNAYRNVLNKK